MKAAAAVLTCLCMFAALLASDQAYGSRPWVLAVLASVAAFIGALLCVYTAANSRRPRP